MATIEILIGDTWDLAHYKIRQYLRSIYPEKKDITYDRLMELYELLDQGNWQEKLVSMNCRSSRGDYLADRNIKFSTVNLSINPKLFTAVIV